MRIGLLYTARDEPLSTSSGGSAMFDELAGLQVGHGLTDLLLRVHHDGSVPRHRLFDRLTRYQQEANPFIASLHANFIAAIEEH